MNDSCEANNILSMIRSKSKRKPESHRIESLDMSLFFRHLSGLESDELQLSAIDENGKVAYSKLRGHRAKTIAACLVDEDGNPVVLADEVNSWDNDVITEMHAVCQKINKIGKDDVAEEVKS